MRMIDVDTLERITRDVFIAWKAPREDAAWIASLLVRANLRGHDSHAVAVPGPNGTVAMSHDFATRVVAEGKPKVKFNRGEKVAPGIMRNGRGEPSTDPREYYADPPGSLITAGARRKRPGSMHIIKTPLLTGPLSGRAGPVPNRMPPRISTARESPYPPGDFHAQVAALFGFVRSAPLAGGSEEILIPGEPEERVSRERRAGGVPIEDETWRQIKAYATEVGVDA